MPAHMRVEWCTLYVAVISIEEGRVITHGEAYTKLIAIKNQELKWESS